MHANAPPESLPQFCVMCARIHVCVCVSIIQLMQRIRNEENKEGERVETVIYFTLLDSIYY